jgi:hypothetical protein
MPEIFPEVFELGLQRLQQLFQLVPVEYPTTRKLNSPLPERARDLHAAFADPEIKGIISSIGGIDEIKLLKYLDAELIKANPKPFFGYSDNTNLHLFLRSLGMLSYHGGSVMVQLGQERLVATPGRPTKSSGFWPWNLMVGSKSPERFVRAFSIYFTKGRAVQVKGSNQQIYSKNATTLNSNTQVQLETSS